MSFLTSTVVRIFIFLVLVATCSKSMASTALTKGYVPENGFVPDEKTAIRVAEAVLSAIYGKEKIESERPFSATLENNIWILNGHFPRPSGSAVAGGVATIWIKKQDGSIVYVNHGR